MYKKSIYNSFFRACCAVCAVAITPIGTVLRASAQTASDDLSFEVATVKPVTRDASHPFDPKHFGAHVNPSGASYWSMTVAYLVAYAYGIQFFQVAGPQWTAVDRFDIEAKFPEAVVQQDDLKMLQALLKDRFRLAFHLERRELEGYALVIGQHGEKLRPSLPDPATPKSGAPLKGGGSNGGEESTKPPTTRKSDEFSTLDIGKRGTQTVKFDQENYSQHWELSKMTMADLAARLSVCMDSSYHKIIDETGKKGSYQVSYDCPVPRPQTPGGMGAAGTLPSDPQGTYLLTRSLDALGLKLEKRKMLMDVYVIDHVEKPSEN